ncbi:HemK family protein methyltransferase, partial [Candidatus Uhrbacteria bacterium]|nr:HemK family protein methyltransferase [Candidatus Uhrbacteria bacterium]
MLLGHVVKQNKAWIVSHGTDVLSNALTHRFEKRVERRKNHEPIAYIIGHKEFYGRPFIVNRNSLIPRPESELFIEMLKKHLDPNETFQCWDVGTGSGAIAITTALEFPKSNVLATDSCKRALAVAEKNVKTYKLSKRITTQPANLLDTPTVTRLQRSNKPLIITANLPYVPQELYGASPEKPETQALPFEPKNALVSEDDGLFHIKKLLE